MAELLAVERVTAGYGESVVLDDVSLALSDGDSLALLGRNGVGKSTLLMTLMGLTTLHRGALRWRGADLAAMPSHRRAHAGLGWVPQERWMWASLTVEEHLTAVARPGPWDVKRAYTMFPRLEERRANYGNQLSGGEQQMLAIARILHAGARLMLLDEPTEGLAPVIVHKIGEVLALLKTKGVSILLAEQNLHFASRIADRFYILDAGKVTATFDRAEFQASRKRYEVALGVWRFTCSTSISTPCLHRCFSAS